MLALPYTHITRELANVNGRCATGWLLEQLFGQEFSDWCASGMKCPNQLTWSIVARRVGVRIFEPEKETVDHYFPAEARRNFITIVKVNDGYDVRYSFWVSSNSSKTTIVGHKQPNAEKAFRLLIPFLRRHREWLSQYTDKIPETLAKIEAIVAEWDVPCRQAVVAGQ